MTTGSLSNAEVTNAHWCFAGPMPAATVLCCCHQESDVPLAAALEQIDCPVMCKVRACAPHFDRPRLPAFITAA